MVDIFKLRDRDAVLSKEGLIFRVYGYFHPPKAYVCDVEYAPDSIYKSIDPRAFRVKRKQEFYKFYTDEGLRFVRKKYPQYTIFYAPLNEFLVGVKQESIWKVRSPDEKLRQLMEKKPRDDLLEKLQRLAGTGAPMETLRLDSAGLRQLGAGGRRSEQAVERSGDFHRAARIDKRRRAAGYLRQRR